MAHWYGHDGTAHHKVPRKKPGKDGSLERATTIRDARQHGWLPSPSGIIGLLEKRGLYGWHADKMYEACFGRPAAAWDKDEIYATYKRLLEVASKEGTRIHALIEKAIANDLWPQDQHDWEIVDGAVRDSFELIPDGWQEETLASVELGYGGTVDRYTKVDEGRVLDYKTTDKVGEKWDNLRLWDSHYMQLAAYRQLIGRPNARCWIDYLSTSFPGKRKLIEAPQDKLDEGWEKFQALQKVWCVFNNYNPGGN